MLDAKSDNIGGFSHRRTFNKRGGSARHPFNRGGRLSQPAAPKVAAADEEAIRLSWQLVCSNGDSARLLGAHPLLDHANGAFLRLTSAHICEAILLGLA